MEVLLVKCTRKCIINIILLGLLIIAILIQLNSSYENAMNDINLRSIYIRQHVEGLMTSSIQQLDLLADQMEEAMNGHQHIFNEKIERKGNNYEVVDRRISLAGISSEPDLNQTTKNEIANILSFENTFITIKNNLKSIEWIYYLSKNNFINIYPNTTYNADSYIPAIYDFEFYKLVLPEFDPERAMRFTKVYEDQLGKGSMITISKPIYRNDEFLGSLSIDYTLKDLSSVLSFESNSLMNYALINEYDQVIASNRNEIEGKYLTSNEYLKLNFGVNLEGVERVEQEIFTNGDYYLLILPLENIPLSIYVIVNRMSLYVSIFSKIMPIIVSLVGIIVILSLYFKTININESLEKSERKFKYVFDQATALAMILDIEGNLIYANQSALNLIGKGIEEVRGQYFSNSKWWAHSSDLRTFIDEAIHEIISGFYIKKDVILMDVGNNEHVYTISMFGIRDDLGNLDYIATTGVEITDRIEMESRLEGLSKTDLLTQTFNRRGMYEILDQSVSLYKRKETPFVVLICDIDYFKNVNDTYGHMVGDEILSGLVQLLKKSARPYDVIGRWGGEEFTVLLQDTTEEEGVIVAERIRRAVSQHPFRSDLTQHVIYISITIGLKAYDSKYDIRQILKMADDALYLGKEKGRNQVVNYDEIKEDND